MDKKKSPFDTSSFNSEIVKDIPQQMNGSDCGMFTCKVYIMFDKFNSLFILRNDYHEETLAIFVSMLVFYFSLPNIYHVMHQLAFLKKICRIIEGG